MDEINSRNASIYEILLTFDFIPDALNNLIVDYQRPSSGEYISQINNLEIPCNIAVDKDYIYIAFDIYNEIKMYNKLNLTLANEFQITSEKIKEYLQLPNDDSTFYISRITVDEKSIYICFNRGSDTIGDSYIFEFDKKGNIIRKIANYHCGKSAITHDSNYIYTLNHVGHVHKYCKKTLAKIKTKIPMDGHVLQSLVVVDENTVYAAAHRFRSIGVFDLKNNDYEEIKYDIDKSDYVSTLASDGENLYLYNKPNVYVLPKNANGKYDRHNKIFQLNTDGKEMDPTYAAMMADDQCLYFVKYNKECYVAIYAK